VADRPVFVSFRLFGGVSMTEDSLRRIADALDRLAPPAADPIDPASAPAWAWNGKALCPVTGFAPLPLALLTGIDNQCVRLLSNTRRHAAGHAAHDGLLWGARGSGKSALAKAVVAAVQAEGAPLVLVEAASEALATLPTLFAAIRDWTVPVIVFLDDLAFEGGTAEARALRSLLEGGAQARPPHVRLYVTSNRRHIVARDMAEQESAINVRDVVDDRLALADRFGLSLGFHVCDQAAWLEMVRGYADHLGLPLDESDALTFAAQRGSRSGRAAWHYAVELAGRAKQAL
jgi:uncharacterized protein